MATGYQQVLVRTAFFFLLMRYMYDQEQQCERRGLIQASRGRDTQKPQANGRLEVVNFDKFLARLQVSPFAPFQLCSRQQHTSLPRGVIKGLQTTHSTLGWSVNGASGPAMQAQPARERPSLVRADGGEDNKSRGLARRDTVTPTSPDAQALTTGAPCSDHSGSCLHVH